ncbi:MAG: RIO1 family regulatory kinase/ATPase, partial [Candidatus Bathyarchaeia archaeon]
FDVSQAVLAAHPNAGALLRRDIERINEYFSRLGVEILSAEYLEVYVRGGEEELYQDSSG